VIRAERLSPEKIISSVHEQLHAFGGRNTQQGKPIANNVAGGFIEPQPRAVQVGHGFVAMRKDPTRAVPPVEASRHLFDKSRHPMRFPKFGGLPHHARKILQGGNEE
jgi:hypothetical protein